MNKIYNLFLSTVLLVFSLFITTTENLVAMEGDGAEEPRAGFGEVDTYEVPAKQDALEEVRFINEIENRLSRDIGAYLGSDRFVLVVDAELRKKRSVVKEAIASAQANLSPPPQFRPVEIDRGISKSNRQKKVEVLPGLPPPPRRQVDEGGEVVDVLRRQLMLLKSRNEDAMDYASKLYEESRSEIRQIKEKTLRFRNFISRLSVSLILDDSVSDEQIEFLRNLINKKAQLDTLRGDTLAISTAPFTKTVADQAIAGAAPIPKPLEWALYGILAMLAAIVLLVFALIRYMRPGGRRMDAQPLRPFDMPTRNEAALPNMVQPMLPNSSEHPASLPSPNEESFRRPQNRAGWEVRQELVTMGLGQPQFFQQLIDTKLGAGQLSEIAAMLKVMGHGLFRSLYPKLSANQLLELENFLSEVAPTVEEMTELLKNFHQQLVHSINESPPSNMPFEFLVTLNNAQIIYLIKEEDARVKALVVSQLPADRAADIIKQLPSGEQSAVAFELGQFETLPVHAFKDIADRLAQKSLDVPSFANISADGISVLIRMLDQMASIEVDHFMNKLQGEKPNTYYRLRQHYFTFSDLRRTPSELISNELRVFDRNVLAVALSHSEDELKFHVLSALPKKLKVAVFEELKLIENETTKEDTEKARNQVVNHMRSVIKAGKLTMESLEPVAEFRNSA